MTKADKKIADLEKRVKELEARPQVVFFPAYQPAPVWPQSPPWSWPIITCTSGAGGITP